MEIKRAQAHKVCNKIKFSVNVSYCYYPPSVSPFSLFKIILKRAEMTNRFSLVGQV